jgi:isopenicillin-N N-acyltransferase like protein
MSILKHCQLMIAALLCVTALADAVEKEGKGFLQIIEGQRVLHLKGSPYERGYQHGKLLKNEIQQNISQFVQKERPEAKERASAFAKNFSKLLSYIPSHFLEEMQGVADGSGIAYQKILELNLFPEMFHCTGMTVSDAATKEGNLYHVRVLDYAVGKGIQSTAVLMVSEPREGHAFLSVSYAGFIGCVTGMNAEKIALGEIGGWGYGFWEGIPMAFLMRQVLENAATLEEAKEIFSKSPRTCEYYYVISDGKTSSSCGVYATASQIHFIEPGSSYALLAPEQLPKNYGQGGEHDKFFLHDYKVTRSPQHVILANEEGRVEALFHQQPKHCVVLTGFANPARYPVLVKRILDSYGTIDEFTLQEMIKSPVTRETNLHNAIFLPSELKVWISHAGPDEEPASEQPYSLYSLADLLSCI